MFTSPFHHEYYNHHQPRLAEDVPFFPFEPITRHIPEDQASIADAQWDFVCQAGCPDTTAATPASCTD